jgi:hypothetical protein
MVFTIWHPFNMQLHSTLMCVLPCRPDDDFLVTQVVRDRDGHIVAEDRPGTGRTFTGGAAVILDYAAFRDAIAIAQCGLVETQVRSASRLQSEPVLYYMGAGTLGSVVYNPPSVMNEGGRLYRYRGFSLHPTQDWVVESGLVVINVSSDPHFSETARLVYEVCGRKGNRLIGDSIAVPPFGTRWVTIGSDQAATEDPLVTMFSESEGPALMSFVYTAARGGGFAIDHTFQPVSQKLYGEDMSSDLGHRYRRLRSRLVRALRYRVGRVDRQPLLRIPV